MQHVLTGAGEEFPPLSFANYWGGQGMPTALRFWDGRDIRNLFIATQSVTKVAHSLSGSSHLLAVHNRESIWFQKVHLAPSLCAAVWVGDILQRAKVSSFNVS